MAAGLLMERPAEGTPGPRVSVVMSNYRGGRYLAAAIESVLAQSVRDLELIVVDDCSGDDGPAIVESYRQRDDRVRLIRLDANLGPAGARNRGIEAARGAWLAIVDNDDLIHPERLGILLDAADRDGADIVADDLLTFYEDSIRIDTMLPETTTEPYWVALPDFIRSNAIYGPSRALGYCKPLFRRQALGAFRYDETLRIGEDANLLVRLLAAGRRFRLYPWLLYCYRKHSGSISYRFSQADSQRLIHAERELLRAHAALGPEIVSAHEAVLASLERAAAFASLIDGLKKRSPAQIVHAVCAAPGALPLLRMPLRAWIERRLQRLAVRRQGTPSLLVLQRSGSRPSGSGAATRRRDLVRLFADGGYSVRTRILGSTEPDPRWIGREVCLELARHGRVAGNVLLAEPSLVAASLPYRLGADSLTLEPSADGVRVHRRGAVAVETRSLAMPAAFRGGPVAAAPDPGEDGHVSIAGARNAAEIAGLNWFLAAVWPRVRETHPNAVLRLGGGLAGVTAPLPPGVVRAEPRADVLAGAGVVVFPRQIFSDDSSAILEALRCGKAVVATSAARGGLAEILQPTVRVADTAAAMAERITELLAAPVRRAELAGAGLARLRSAASGGGEDPLAELLASVRPPANAAGAQARPHTNMPGVPVEKRL
ncbi:glycosyltransferase involved in cell wall biosynthesis [Methylorubrum extorquens]|uniref:glycosyltransferase n=1 Tax=Methylorubrum extorquens TaxID=408 RepID=UPI0020A0EDBF|nr:glycosyltransferase [Methylorubrum extorquens]MCP1561115.1 glycosyltransferase involved in cell wall biosynthesis [Methylorubrum extorquens]MDF9789595.1 glycosyltransferase involved in cell wall biosynthesis [Methylorubrum extorquens]MDF9861312.1 glycosyltransferase involved in cell wall biosynthesis [Methylorubrum pseudosasae]MDH6664109.1 glycosyltransferase involved in cell wall biosynthesis [Methylorubrum zatmanii]